MLSYSLTHREEGVLVLFSRLRKKVNKDHVVVPEEKHGKTYSKLYSPLPPPPAPGFCGCCGYICIIKHA